MGTGRGKKNLEGTNKGKTKKGTVNKKLCKDHGLPPREKGENIRHL